MSAKKHITFKIIIFLFCIDLLETFAQFCFKKCAFLGTLLDIKTASDAAVFLKAVIPSPFLWLGLFSVLCMFISWSTVLSRIDLSVAIPVCSFSYITIPLISMLVFHETVSLVRWLGIGLILVGVIFVSKSSMVKEKLI